LLLDEPTNHLDMESIDALAKAVNEFEGGMVLVSHDMRLIGQVAKEIWICDNKTITPYRGDIMNFKMDMRAQMGMDNTSNSSNKLRGDASVKASEKLKEKPAPKKEEPKLEVVRPTVPKTTTIREEPSEPTMAPSSSKKSSDAVADDATATTIGSSATATSGESTVINGGAAPKKYIPPHLRKKMSPAV
jgi:ATP-binding cassette subfamily F protein 2